MKKKSNLPAQNGPGGTRATKMVEGLLQGKTIKAAAVEAGFSESYAHGRILQTETYQWIVDRVAKRQKQALELAGITSDNIIGYLSEIAHFSLGDIRDEQGNPSMDVAVAKGLDHLIESYEVITNYYGTRVIIKPYSRDRALAQLRDTFGIKMEPRPNDYDEQKIAEVERSLNNIMERERVDRPTAAKSLLDAVGPTSPLKPIIAKYVM
jgi:hypothetical protein